MKIVIGVLATIIVLTSYFLFLFLGPPEIVYLSQVNSIEVVQRYLSTGVADESLEVFGNEYYFGLADEEIFVHKVEIGSDEWLVVAIGFDSYLELNLASNCWVFERFRLSSLGQCDRF